MKAIICSRCEDLVALSHTARQCRCGGSGGHYLANDHDAIYWGAAVPLGFINSEFTAAVKAHSGTFSGKVFERDAPTFKRIGKPRTT